MSTPPALDIVDLRKRYDNGVEAPVMAGDVTVCNDGESHGLLNTGSTDLKMVALILFTK